MKKIVALSLICALICSALSGCFYVPRITVLPPESGDTARPRPSAVPPSGADGDYFADEVWRGDTAFSDMAYEHYEAEWFEEYTAPMYAIAEEGGSQSQFDDADYYLWDELNYVYTMAVLADLAYSADPSDKAASEEKLYCGNLYDELSCEYWKAMHAVAASRHRELMKDAYADWQIEWFARYDSSADPDSSLYTRENELLTGYYSLMAEESPDYDAIAELYVELVGIRNSIAEQSGYDSYADYAYEGLYGRDYRPEDAPALWEYTKEYFVPLVEKYAVSVGDAASGIYWSGGIDCSPEAVLAAMEYVLPRISGELYDAYEYMLEYGLCDIELSDSKMSTGYTTVLYWYNEPYIFNCPYNSYYDYSDMFHEFGHFCSYFYSRSDLVFGNSDNDLAELQSQGLEALATCFYDELFGGENGGVMRADVLLNIVYSVVDGAMYDEFQRRVYEAEDLTADGVSEIYAELYAEYGYTPAEGSENGWMLVEHNFSRPFYYISYGVSALGALELFALAQEDSFESACDKYLICEAMDPEVYYLSDALAAAGLGGTFDEENFRKAAQALDDCFAA